MTVEVAEPISESADGPALVPEEEPKQPRVRARSSRLAAAPVPPPRDQVAPELRSARQGGDRDLADIINSLGSQGGYRIKVQREEPEFVVDPATQERVPVAGFLKEYTDPIDEERIKKNHGGGKYRIQFQRANERGSFVYATQVTKVISGDPRLDDPALNRLPKPAAAPAPAPPAPAPDSSAAAVFKEAFGVLASQLDRAGHQEARGPDPMVALLQQQNNALMAEIRDLRTELVKIHTAKPPEDTFKDKLLGSMIDNDSARIESIRVKHEAEIRMLKEAAIAAEQRVREQAALDRSEIKASHQREIDLMKQGHQVQLDSVKSSADVQKQAMESERRSLERALADAKEELKELRGKKDKPLIDQVKDIQSLKEAIGIDEGESSTVDKLLGALPEALPIVGSWLQKEKPKEAEKPVKSRVVQTPDGHRYLQKPDGSLVGPLKKKPAAAAPAAAGGEQAAQPAVPTIDPAQMKEVVDYLTRACDNNADPEIVAQSSRPRVPDWLMQLLRVKSVDEVFFTMAQLPTGSSLSTQKGRVWLRKVGAALVGG